MSPEMQKVLYDAPAALNRPDQPWEATVEGDSIVARWKWMDAVFFAPGEVSDETRNYAFVVTLTDKKRWHELDKTGERTLNVGMDGGNLRVGGSSQKFIGKKAEKSVTFGLGMDKQTGQAGIVGFKFDTSMVKKPIRAYLESCGWKKAGLFG